MIVPPPKFAPSPATKCFVTMGHNSFTSNTKTYSFQQTNLSIYFFHTLIHLYYTPQFSNPNTFLLISFSPLFTFLFYKIIIFIHSSISSTLNYHKFFFFSPPFPSLFSFFWCVCFCSLSPPIVVCPPPPHHGAHTSSLLDHHANWVPKTAAKERNKTIGSAWAGDPEEPSCVAPHGQENQDFPGDARFAGSPVCLMLE
jgi:hypothetical protein